LFLYNLPFPQPVKAVKIFLQSLQIVVCTPQGHLILKLATRE
jgi:hypothetical protein